MWHSLISKPKVEEMKIVVDEGRKGEKARIGIVLYENSRPVVTIHGNIDGRDRSFVTTEFLKSYAEFKNSVLKTQLKGKTMKEE